MEQDGAVARRVQELVRVPARRAEGAGLGLAVADDAEDDEPGIVKGGAERVREGVAELSAFVDAAGRLGGDVAGDAARERELLEEKGEAFGVLRDVRVNLAVRALEVDVGHDAGAAVARAGDEDGVEVPILDDAVGVQVEKVEPGRGAPVPEKARFDVLEAEGLTEERIREEVDLPYGEVVRGAKVPVHVEEKLAAERSGHGGYVGRSPGRSRDKDVAMTRSVCRTMMASSSVRMTRTVQGLASVETTGAPASLRRGSSTTPR